MLELLNGQIKEQEKRIAAENVADEATELVQSVPGLGVILAAVIASEIDEITRFADTEHLCAYAGLVPTTHGSGGQSITASCCGVPTNGCAGPLSRERGWR